MNDDMSDDELVQQQWETYYLNKALADGTVSQNDLVGYLLDDSAVWDEWAKTATPEEWAQHNLHPKDLEGLSRILCIVCNRHYLGHPHLDQRKQESRDLNGRLIGLCPACAKKHGDIPDGRPIPLI